MSDKPEYDLNLRLTDPPKYGDKIVVNNDVTIRGTVQAYNIGYEWSLVEYISKIIDVAALNVEEDTRIKIFLGAFTAPLDLDTLNANLRANFSSLCRPVRASVVGLTHDVVQNDKGVWLVNTTAHVLLRPVGIEDLAYG